MEFIGCVTILAFIVVGVINWQVNKKLSFGMVMSQLLFTLILSFVLAITGILIVNGVAETELVEDYQYPIFALQDKTTYLGKFQSNGGIMYEYMYQAEDGGQKIGKIDVSDASIFQDGEPKIVVLKSQFKNPSIRKYFSDLMAPTETKFQIHVPQGTIKEEFNVDLK